MAKCSCSARDKPTVLQRTLISLGDTCSFWFLLVPALLLVEQANPALAFCSTLLNFCA